MEENNKNILHLVSNIPVSVNHYIKPRGFIMKVGGAPKVQVTMYETSDAKKYKKEFMQHVQKELKNQQWNIEENKFIIVEATFYFDRTHKDTNNHWKIMLDALTECGIWKDDSLVMERVNRIYYDSKNPRIELKIYHSDHIGIFNNDIEYKTFIHNCESCTRYNRNCSLLKSALESRIQEEINLIDNKFVCNKFKEIKK